MSTWFSPAPDAAGGMRLFCFPFAGGNAASFLGWQGPLGPDLELRVAQLPGRGARLFEKPLTDLDELVEHLAEAVAELDERPFAFFGHSLGAMLAFEVARALRRQGRPGPSSLWLAGAEAPQTRSVPDRVHDLPTAAFIEVLRDYGGTPAELLDNRDMMELLLPGLRADFALDEGYAYRPEPPLAVPIHLLLGDRDPEVEPVAARDGWARETAHPLLVHGYAGDHFFVQEHRDAIAALLAAVLTPQRSAPR